MEALLLLILIILMIIFMNRWSRSNKLLDRMDTQLHSMQERLRQLQHQLEKLQPQPGHPPEIPPDPPQPVEPLPAVPPIIMEMPAPEQDVLADTYPAPALQPGATMNPEPASAATPAAVPDPPQPAPAYEAQESWLQRWLRRNPDLEKFIGENLINKIGIAILVLGIAFFVRYAIDREWISETGRVAIGLVCGAGLIGLAHYMRLSYRAFSSVLAGGGLAVLYLTIAIAFHEYTLLSQTAAFIIMVVITAFAVALALLYDKLELAAIALAGGFITPLLVSTGSGNYVVLFTYLAILNAGLLALAVYKRWPLIHALALAFTIIIYGGWMLRSLFEPGEFPYAHALLFASVFYALFTAMSIVYQMRHRLGFRPFDFSLLLLVNASYFAAGITITHLWVQGRYQGLFTLVMGMANLSLAWYAFKRRRQDRNLLYLLIGLTLTFITLAVPVQLEGHTITLFWSAEFVMLYWLWQRSGIRVFQTAAQLLAAMALISLLIDWSQASALATGSLNLIYTDMRGLVTNLVAAAAYAAWAVLLHRETGLNPEQGLSENKPRLLMLLSGATAFIILLLTAYYGVNLIFRDAVSTEIPNVYHRLVSGLFALGLVFFTRKKKLPKYTALIATGLFYLHHIISFVSVRALTGKVLYGPVSAVHLALHWLTAALLLYLLWLVTGWLRAESGRRARLAAWIMGLAIILFISMEGRHIYLAIGSSMAPERMLAHQYRKAGLTLLWSGCSFVLMWLGMRHQYKPLRIMSLCLFTVVLLKLFFWDIRNLGETARILAFVLLGIVLLVVSFMYQKLKKILFDDGKP